MFFFKTFVALSAAYLLLQTSTINQSLIGLYPGDTSRKHTGSSTHIPLNPSAAWGEDVRSIQHFPQERQVVITFARYARCPRPYLLGRLSGPALVVLENWTFEGDVGFNEQPAAPTTTYTTGESTMTASYRVPVSGLYFVEILALFCEDYSYQLLHNESLGEWMNSAEGKLFLNYDMTGTCTEDPRTNRLTDKSAALQILLNHTTPVCDNGCWLNTHTKQVPLYTRWQPTQCFLAKKAGEPTPKECKPAISLKRFQSYTFQWDAPDLADLRQQQQTSFCMIGASHSEGLAVAGKRVFDENTNITTAVTGTTYPNLATREHFKNLSHFNANCTHYIIATGQWPGSFDHAHPHSWAQWEHDNRQMIRRFQNFSSNFILRSIHYNPMGHPRVTCPATDWRNPMVLDGYNAILKQVCEEEGVPFLDTRWIDGAIWDAAPDWCHITPEANDVEVLYLVAASLGYYD